MEEAGTHIAEITEFVPIESIDPVYFDKAYYLAPDKGGAKPYALLAKRAARVQALRARPLGRARQAVHRDDPSGRGRARHAAASLRRRGAVDQGHRDPEDRGEGRRAQARAAADRAAGLRHVRPQRVHRRRARARIEAAVQKKVEGQEITMAEAPEGGGAQVIDLMEALRASLEKKAPAKAREPQAEARKPPKRAQQAEPAAKKSSRNSARKQEPVRPPCTSTVCVTSRSCFACRAARFAR